MAQLPSQFITRFYDDGELAAGYRLFTFESGTTTPKTSYKNRAGSQAHTNPIILDANGEPPEGFFLGDGFYTIRLNAPVADGGGVIQTWDGVSDGGASALAASGGAGLVGYAWASSNADQITVESALRQEFVLERAYRSTDLGKWGPAFQRLANNPDCKVIKIAATQQNVFNVNGTVAIDRSDITIMTPGRFGAEIYLQGSDPYLFDLGGTAAKRFNVYIHNLIFARETAASSGAMLRLRNLYLWGYHNCRFYMGTQAEQKSVRGVELASCSFGRCTANLSEFPIREHIHSAGGPGGAGDVGGWAVGNQWNGMTIEGGHWSTANPEDQGCIVLDDHVAAHWFQDVESFRHYGYLWYLKGTLANQGRNTLNLIFNPNIECTYPNADRAGGCGGTVRIDNFQSTQIRDGWSEGNECAAIRLTANSKSNLVSDMQLGLKGAGSSGVRDGGTNNTRNNMEYVGYTSGANTPTAGLRYDSTVKRPIDTEFTVLQTTLGVSSAAVATANVNIRQMRYKSLVSGPFDSNLQGTSNATIGDVVSQDDGATPFATAAATLGLFPGYAVHYVDGTTAIDSIPAGYIGQTLTLRLRTSGASVRDLVTSGGNIALAVSGVSLTSLGRTAVTLQWDGTYWWEISRNT